MDEVRVEVTLSRMEYMRGVRFFLRKSGVFSRFDLVIFPVILAITVGLLWLTGMTLANTGLLVLLAMAAALGSFVYFAQPGRIFDRSPQLQERVVYTFSPESIGVRSASVAGVVQWSFVQFWIAEEFYILVQDKRHYTLFPKRAFSSPDACAYFEALVGRAVPDIQIRDYR